MDTWLELRSFLYLNIINRGYITRERHHQIRYPILQFQTWSISHLNILKQSKNSYPILATLDHLRNHSLRDYRHEIKGEPRVIPGPKRRGKPTHPSPKYRGHLPRVVRLLTRRRTRRIRFWATPTSARRWPSYAWSLTSVRTGTRSSGAASGGSV